jgi:predicted acyl esterase
MTNAAAYRAAAPVIYDAAMGVSGVNTFPPDPIQDQPTYAGAKAAFEALPSIRVLFDNGAGGSEPGQPLPGFEHSFPSFPVPGTKARTWYLGADHKLADAPAATAGTDSFTWDAKARPLTNFTGDTGSGDNGLWTATPPYKWLEPPAGTGVSYMTEPLKESAAVVGAGAHLWVRASKPRVDLQATITEVRPDGKETFVQGGWLRGDMRKLDPAKSTPLEPVLGLRNRDVRPLPRKRFVKATLPLYYQGHAYRAGSRIRVIITAPNGDQPIWSFTTRPKGKAKVGIAHGATRPSDLTLPVVPGVDVPTDLPPCPGLRGEPCRTFAG